MKNIQVKKTKGKTQLKNNKYMEESKPIQVILIGPPQTTDRGALIDLLQTGFISERPLCSQFVSYAKCWFLTPPAVVIPGETKAIKSILFNITDVSILFNNVTLKLDAQHRKSLETKLQTADIVLYLYDPSQVNCFQQLQDSIDLCTNNKTVLWALVRSMRGQQKEEVKLNVEKAEQYWRGKLKVEPLDVFLNSDLALETQQEQQFLLLHTMAEWTSSLQPNPMLEPEKMKAPECIVVHGF
jgi:hypothetical protein